MSRLSKALLVALALHGLLLLTHARSVARKSALVPRAPEELVVFEEAPQHESAPTAAAGQPEGTSHRASASSSVARARGGSPAPEGQAEAAVSDADAPSGTVAAAAASAGAPQASAAKAERKIDFGIDDGFFMRPPSEQLPRVGKPVYLQQLQAALSADDVRRGLARGNALLSSLNAAVRDVGPVRGEALLSVTIGADGGFTSAELLRGTPSEWASVLDSFKALAARKRLRVPPGANGLRVTFSIQAKVQRPSGKGVDASGADIPPNGILRRTFDLADLGAGTQRLVYAHVVSEEVL